MAGEPITSEMVQEAGIAARLATVRDVLPQEISELSDQAAIFASQSINAFMLRGAADADSAATNFGTSLATKAVERMIELEAERRKEDDPASDGSMIAEAGAAMREELAEMQRVSVGGVELSLEEWDEIAETLSTEEGRGQLKALLMAEGKSEAEADQIIYLTEMAARIAQKEGNGLPLTAEEREVQRRLENNQVDSDRLEDGVAGSRRLSSALSQNDLPPEAQIRRELNQVEDDAAFQEATAQISDDADVAGLAVEARNGMSLSGASDLANSFEAGFSAAPEFNDQASGIQLAQAEPVQSAPTVSGPALS